MRIAIVEDCLGGSVKEVEVSELTSTGAAVLLPEAEEIVEELEGLL